VSGINIHISLEAIAEEETGNKQQISGCATVIKSNEEIMTQYPGTIFDAGGRIVREFDKVLAPGVYFVKQEKGRGLRKLLLVR